MEETVRLTTDFLAQFFRRMLVPVGAIVAIISGLGIAGNYSEWEAHPRRRPGALFMFSHSEDTIESNSSTTSVPVEDHNSCRCGRGGRGSGSRS